MFPKMFGLLRLVGRNLWGQINGRKNKFIYCLNIINKKMVTIKTKELILRPLRLSDARGYWEVMRDSETQKGFTSFPKSFVEAKKEVKDMLKEIKEKDSRIFTIIVNKKYAGNVVLQYQNWDKLANEGRVHVWIHPNFRGLGLATKAIKEAMKFGFQKKKFKKIFVQCKASNKAVINVIKKCGFKKLKVHKTDGGIKKILWVKER